MKFEFQVNSVWYAVGNIKVQTEGKAINCDRNYFLKYAFAILAATLRGHSKNHLFFRQLEAPSECCWKAETVSLEPFHSAIFIWSMEFSYEWTAPEHQCQQLLKWEGNRKCQLIPSWTSAAGIKEKKTKMSSSLRVCLCWWLYKGLSQAQLVSKCGDLVSVF